LATATEPAGPSLGETLPDLTPEEKQRLAEVPKGTWALTLIVVITMIVAWFALYLLRFMAQGPVN
jgi:hypothetical protein